MTRIRQSHDVWHPLIGLGVEGHEEVLLHAFTFGQLRLPLSILIMFFGGAKHMLLERRFECIQHSFLEAYQMGLSAELLLAVRWEELWQSPLEDVQKRYRVRAMQRARFVSGA